MTFHMYKHYRYIKFNFKFAFEFHLLSMRRLALCFQICFTFDLKFLSSCLSSNFELLADMRINFHRFDSNLAWHNILSLLRFKGRISEVRNFDLEPFDNN